MSSREDVIVLGRLLGTFDGWDQVDESEMVFYNFRPAVGVNLPDGDLVFNWQEGKIITQYDNGVPTCSIDAATFCATLPQVTHDQTQSS